MDIKSVQGSLAYQTQMNRPQQAGTQRAQGPATPPPQQTDTVQTQTGADRINLSFDGVLRTAALSTAMRSDDVRQEKVDAIKESVDKGTYVIDNHKIAAKLVQDERAIFGNK